MQQWIDRGMSQTLEMGQKRQQSLTSRRSPQRMIKTKAAQRALSSERDALRDLKQRPSKPKTRAGLQQLNPHIQHANREQKIPFSRQNQGSTSVGGASIPNTYIGNSQQITMSERVWIERESRMLIRVNQDVSGSRSQNTSGISAMINNRRLSDPKQSNNNHHRSQPTRTPLPESPGKSHYPKINAPDSSSSVQTDT